MTEKPRTEPQAARYIRMLFMPAIVLLVVWWLRDERARSAAEKPAPDGVRCIASPSDAELSAPQPKLIIFFEAEIPESVQEIITAAQGRFLVAGVSLKGNPGVRKIAETCKITQYPTAVFFADDGKTELARLEGPCPKPETVLAKWKELDVVLAPIATEKPKEPEK